MSKLLFIVFLFILFLTSCAKEDLQIDYAPKVEGYYIGQSRTAVITRTGINKVTMTFFKEIDQSADTIKYYYHDLVVGMDRGSYPIYQNNKQVASVASNSLQIHTTAELMFKQ